MSPISFGRNNESCGNAITTTNNNVSKSIIGSTSLTTPSKVPPDTFCPTNRFTPSGGVRNPIQRFTHITSPKYIRLYPSAETIGQNNGANKMMFDVVSINIPAIRRIKFIISIIMIGLLDTP